LAELNVALVLTLLAALLFDFINGYLASSSLVATVVASGAMNPRPALLLASLAVLLGPLALGVSVAGTIGRDLVNTAQLPLIAVLAMVIGALAWLLFTYWLGLPVSPSHALIGGMLGVAIAAQGLQAVRMAGLTRVVLGLFAAPIIGVVAGWLFMEGLLFALRGAAPNVSKPLKRAQIGASFLLALSQGSNDAQKTIGLITMTLVIAGKQSEFRVPFWVVLLSALVIALGVSLGGTRTMRTIGSKFFRVRPVHGFATQTVSAGVVLLSALFGAPVSTSQVVSSALVGVGSAERMSKVHWSVAGNIALAWLFTIPAAALVSAIVYFILQVSVSMWSVW
jgi:inorganic phosphate transporter, PiT family